MTPAVGWPGASAVVYRVLGLLAEADDAIQEAWLRLAPSAFV